MKIRDEIKPDRLVNRFAWFPVYIKEYKTGGMLGVKINDGYWIWLEKYYSVETYHNNNGYFQWLSYLKTQSVEITKMYIK